MLVSSLSPQCLPIRKETKVLSEVMLFAKWLDNTQVILQARTYTIQRANPLPLPM